MRGMAQQGHPSFQWRILKFVVLFFLSQVLALLMFWAWLFGPRVGLGLAIFLAATGLAAQASLFRFGPLPPPIFLALPFVTAATIYLARTLPIARAGVPLLIGFQSFRILVEVFLWWGHREGVVPVQLTWEGRNLDIITGITAPIVAFLASRQRTPDWLLAGWNFMGLALLVNVVSVAALSMPTPLQRFQPTNTFVAEWPYVWLPLFVVQSALFGHVALWRLIAR
jgi:hypothetical protein